ncbi:FecCD family ABC transporter permease [Lacicoccus alkaliphilus]|uniref:Iron complex transport system permease protein n=1 Tax=Lacicoccus alkaliphilus DSM 16010 TaxID=1123231 RepID=A0A1M7K836_9BACL|nr:iron ABC transporter permease [Salinicoccus alkaliphilus]SHM61440.1 iron complex transport system permease protein [Salinicoccus alkaliphilus DSM 16010]
MNYKRSWVVLTAVIVLLLGAMAISLKTGYTDTGWRDIAALLTGVPGGSEVQVLMDIRLPRVLTAVLSGAALALSGAILQSIMQNPLADSGIIGINSGAGFAVLLFMMVSGDSEAGVFLIPFLAFLGGLAVALAVVSLSYSRKYGLTPMRLILNGIASGAGISALMIVLSLVISSDSYLFTANFLAGTVWGSTWAHVLVLTAGLAALLPFVIRKIPVLDILSLNTLNIISLGVNIRRERLLLLISAAGLSAVSVSVSGGIAFVGLIAPHLARRLMGTGHRFVLPLSALAGGLLVLTADTAGRTLFFPSALPAGVMVAIIGAPYFIYILMKSESR